MPNRCGKNKTVIRDGRSHRASTSRRNSTKVSNLVTNLPPLLLNACAPGVSTGNHITLPTGFHSRLNRKLMVTQNRRHYICLLPFSRFHHVTSRVRHASINGGTTHRCLHIFLSNTISRRPSGRKQIIIPRVLHSCTGLKSSVIIVNINAHTRL